MLVEGDLERACRVASKQQKRRPRALPLETSDGWTAAGRSCAPTFWPRFADICLVTAGVRCAVLLDSRRAPRGSPPLADVLLALQQDQQQQQQKFADGCGSGGCDVACLGSLVLDGSLFLVNRVLLLQRLNELPWDTFAAEGGCMPPGDTRERDSAGTPAARPIPERRGGCTAPSTAPECAAGQGQRQGRREFALVDVRRLLPMPCDRSDVLGPRLQAALCSAFRSAGADKPPPSCDAPFLFHGVPTTKEAREDRTSGTGEDRLSLPREREGAQWLHDWERKEVVLDCESLRETLGDVGLSGLAGWLLEYPVIYCCPSLIGTGDVGGSAGGSGGGTEEDEHVMGNCLAAVPLTVYSLSVDLGSEGTGAAAGAPPLQAFSFSVPDEVSGPPEAVNHGEGVEIGLRGPVDRFLRKLEARIARHRRIIESDGWHQPLVRALNVTKRAETLERVAL